jgi:hypothetical protein
MLDFGKAIYHILSGNTALATLVNNNIYPLVVPEDVIFPCIHYTKTCEAEYSRDGISLLKYNVTITAITKGNEYENSINIAKAVQNCMNINNSSVDGYNIRTSRLIAANEEFDFSNNYILQTVVYQMNVTM